MQFVACNVSKVELHSTSATVACNIARKVALCAWVLWSCIECNKVHPMTGLSGKFEVNI